MPVTIAPREHTKALIDRAIRKALARSCSRPRPKFLQFLGDVRDRSDLLRPARLRCRPDDPWLDAILRGLLALFACRKDWMRPVESWRPEETNPLPLFSSLAHHLIAQYPVPRVLLSAWFRGVNEKGRREQCWFAHAGRGGSLRTAGFPIILSKRMAHELAHAPAFDDIDFALRWAQVRGLGGSDTLARTVAATRLGRWFVHDEFWVSVIHLFINTPRLDPAHVDPIVEYLNDQKFRMRPVIIGGDVEVDLGPPQPELSVKGRTVASLMRRVEEWKAEQRTDKPRPTLIRWDRSAIGEFRGQDGEGRDWSIRELLDSDELAAEGKAMSHCVATYTGCCSRRVSTIWSVGTESAEGRQRFATVEVNPKSREIYQAKARFNEEPDASAMAILREWAAREGLNLEG